MLRCARNTRYAGIFIMVVLILLTQLGCWDVEDIRDRAFVTAIGVDMGEEPYKYKVTFEILRPAGMKYGSKEPASFTQTIQGDSINQALEQLQTRTSRSISLAHMRLLLIGEGQARENILDVLDYFIRHQEVQMRIRLIFIQDGEAMEALQIEPKLERFPSEEIVALARLAPYVSLAGDCDFMDVVGRMRRTKGTAYGARALVSSDGRQIIKHGAAIFKDYKLIGWLSSQEVQRANWIIEKRHYSVDGKNDKGIFSFDVDHKNCNIIPHIVDNQLSFTVEIETDGTIRQKQGELLDLTKPENIEQLEDLFSREIKREATEAIRKAQKEFGVDYLNFHLALQQANNKFFQTLDWEKEFPHIPIQVVVKVNITRFGLSQ